MMLHDFFHSESKQRESVILQEYRGQAGLGAGELRQPHEEAALGTAWAVSAVNALAVQEENERLSDG